MRKTYQVPRWAIDKATGMLVDHVDSTSRFSTSDYRHGVLGTGMTEIFLDIDIGGIM